MAGVDDPGRVHRAARGDERLARHLAAEHPLCVLLRAATTEQVHLERFEVEQRDEVVEGGLGHRARVTAGLTHST